MMVGTPPWPLFGFGASLLVWGVYSHIWRYTSVAELTRLVYGVLFAGLLTASAVLMLRVESFPRSVLLLHPMLALLLLGGARISARLLLVNRAQRVPAGEAPCWWARCRCGSRLACTAGGAPGRPWVSSVPSPPRRVERCRA